MQLPNRRAQSSLIRRGHRPRLQSMKALHRQLHCCHRNRCCWLSIQAKQLPNRRARSSLIRIGHRPCLQNKKALYRQQHCCHCNRCWSVNIQAKQRMNRRELSPLIRIDLNRCPQRMNGGCELCCLGHCSRKQQWNRHHRCLIGKNLEPRSRHNHSMIHFEYQLNLLLHWHYNLWQRQ